jgi:hypothetical protein
MFHEIKRPFKVVRDQVFKRINIFSLPKRMLDDAKAAMENENKKPPVAKNVTKAEFKNRYKGLLVHTFVVLVALLYTFLFLASSKTLLALIVSLLITSFFAVNYILSLYRAWIARFYFRNWEDRFNPKAFTIGAFFDAIYKNPSLIFPVTKIGKGI